MNTECDSFFSQSYWDWLPFEIQEYVTQLAAAQHLRDIHDKTRHKELWVHVCKELMIYFELKRLWGNHIKFKIEPGHLLGDADANLTDSTGTKKHLVIFGRHVILHDARCCCPFRGPRTEEAFITYGLKNAFRAIETFYDY